MKQILRYSFVALMAMVFCNAQAEDIIWQEDFSSYSADNVPSGGTYNYACENGGGTTKIYTASLAGGTAPELLIAKSNGSFSAVIPLGGKSGELTLSYKVNYDRVAVTSSTTNVNVGEKSGTGTYIYTITVPSGTESLALEFKNTTTSNVRIDDIKLYQGTAKKPAGLSWGTASRSVTLNANDNVFPTLTNENNLTVTYASSETTVATIDASSGTITLVAAGSTTISAEFAGNDEYEAQKVEYALTVNPAASTTSMTIAEFNALDANAKGILQLTDAQVLGTGNKYLVVKDATGVIMINEQRTEGAITATQGQKLSGTINGTKTAFGGLNGIKTISASEVTVADGTITPTTVAVTEIAGKDYLTELYKLENVTLKADEGKYFIMNGEDKVLQIYDEFKLNAITADGTYTLEGLRGKYNTTEQFWPTKVTSTSGVSAIKADVDANAPAYNVAGQKVAEGYKGLVIKGGKKVIQK